MYRNSRPARPELVCYQCIFIHKPFMNICHQIPSKIENINLKDGTPHRHRGVFAIGDVWIITLSITWITAQKRLHNNKICRYDFHNYRITFNHRLLVWCATVLKLPLPTLNTDVVIFLYPSFYKQKQHCDGMPCESYLPTSLYQQWGSFASYM